MSTEHYNKTIGFVAFMTILIVSSCTAFSVLGNLQATKYHRSLESQIQKIQETLDKELSVNQN